MQSTIISVFNFKGHDVRFAFDKDEAYIFVEDGKKLEHLFIEDDPTLVFDPVISKKITVNQPGKIPQEHWVAPIITKLFAQCDHYPKAEEWFYFTIWLHEVVWQAHREHQHRISTNTAQPSGGPAFKLLLPGHNYKSTTLQLREPDMTT